MKIVRGTLLLVFFGLLHLLPLLKVWGLVEGRIAATVALMSLIPLGLAVPYFRAMLAHKRRLSWLDTGVMAYAAWSALSGLLFLQPGNPVFPLAYVFGVYNLLLPIACYFAVKSLPRNQLGPLVGRLALLNVLVLAYALFLHFARPEYYVEFVTNELLPSKGYTDSWQFFARLQAHLGSTTAGYLGATTIVLLTLGDRRHLRWLPVAVPVCISVAMLSMQRSSMVGAMLAVAYVVLLLRRSRLLRIVATLALIATFALGLNRFHDDAGAFSDRLKERSTSDLSDAFTNLIEDRGYALGWRFISAFPLGVGLGATSSAADSAGLNAWNEVADANLARIAADLGVIGLLLFLGVLGTAAWRALRSQHRYGWLIFLSITTGVIIGTNILDSYFVSHLFWLLLAVLDGDYRAKAKPSEPVQLSPPDFRIPPAAQLL